MKRQSGQKDPKRQQPGRNMTNKIKETILNRGVKAIPNVIWAIIASYALFMLTNLFVLNFARIDADKHINRYFDIILSEKESQDCSIDESFIKQTNDRLKLLEEDNDRLKQLSHPPGGSNDTDS